MIGLGLGVQELPGTKTLHICGAKIPDPSPNKLEVGFVVCWVGQFVGGLVWVVGRLNTLGGYFRIWVAENE